MRLRPFTSTQPKVMVPLANRPLLEHVLLALKAASIRDIVLIVGYKHERVQDAMGNGKRLGIRIRYVAQKQQLGTAHALAEARQYVRGPTLVINGDILIDAKAIQDLLKNPQGEMSILCVSRPGIQRLSLILEKDRVQKIQPGAAISESDAPVNTGVYLLTKEIFKDSGTLELSSRGEYELIDALQKAIDRGIDVRARITGHEWHEIATPGDLLRVNGLAVDRVVRDSKSPATPRRNGAAMVEPGARIRGPVVIGSGTRIRAGSYIVGPVILGSRCDIGPYAVVLPSTSIGDGCILGPFTTVRNSILMDDVHVEPHAHMANAVIGHHVRIGAGSHLEAPGPLSKPEGESTGVDVGPLVGEGALIGDRVLVGAGHSLGSRCKVASGAVVRQNVPENAVVL